MDFSKTAHIREVLSSSKLPLKARLIDFKIQTSWPLIVGEHLAKKSSPLKRLEGTLYVNVSSQAWMTEFQYQKAEIIDRVNRELSDDTKVGGSIRDIIFRPGKLTRNRPKRQSARQTQEPEPIKELTSERRSFIEKTISPIKDKDIREIITRTMSRDND
jgi:hypothetical protein